MLRIPVSHGAKIEGKNEATVTGCRPGVNLGPFGLYAKSQPPVPCAPVLLTNWLLGNNQVVLNGETALLSSSILSCACGGIIKIQV